MGWIATAFDPDVLTIGFARRVPTYKRLTLMLRDPERLEKLLLDEKRPLQLIVAGKSHPADDGGKALIQQVVRFADRPEVRHRIAFLPDYDMSMARLLYWGCDVWLNNPLRPLEACGTSGMKSALNGGLNLSIRDGWWDEWYDGENGWEIPTADGLADEARRDDLEAAALYDLLEKSVTPKFYDRDEHGIPDALGRDGAAHAAGARAQGAGLADGAGLHREVLRARRRSRCTAPSNRSTECRSVRPANWPPTGERAQEAWPKIQITDVDSYGLPDTPLLGSELTLTATVHLAGLRARRGRGPGGASAASTAATRCWIPSPCRWRTPGSADGGNEVFSTTTPLPVAGSGRLHGARAAAPSAAGGATTSWGSSHSRESHPRGRHRRRALRAGGRARRRDVGHAGARRRDRPGRRATATSTCIPSRRTPSRRSSPPGPTARCGSPGPVTTGSAGSPPTVS